MSLMHEPVEWTCEHKETLKEYGRTYCREVLPERKTNESAILVAKSEVYAFVEYLINRMTIEELAALKEELRYV